MLITEQTNDSMHSVLKAMLSIYLAALFSLKISLFNKVKLFKYKHYCI